MVSPASSADLAAASSKLADRGRQARHGQLFSIAVTTSDGQRATVSWEIDTHRAECLPYVLRQIADVLRLDGPDDAREALMSWSREQLIAHLQQFTQAELRPPAFRRR